MDAKRSHSITTEKWKSYVAGMLSGNLRSLRKIDKYFRINMSESMSKAIEENWIRMIGMEYEIISLNMCKNNEPLGIALQPRNVLSTDSYEIMQRHNLRAIMPRFCVGRSNRFMVGDEILEVNGLKIFGMKSKDVASALKKLPNNIQIVVARPLRQNFEDTSDYGDIGELHSPISFYDMDEDFSSHASTIKSNSSIFSSTSRDFGSAVSVDGVVQGRYGSVSEYLRTIIGWRGPIVIEFRKRSKETLGIAMEEIKDPKSSQLIIVFKIVLPNRKAAEDGRLQVGDRLLQVNGKSVVGVSFKKVCQWMKSAPGGRLVLYICKPHFQTFEAESTDYLPDNYLYHTLNLEDTLPKLSEENSDEVLQIPPVPKCFEMEVFIDGTGDKLGLFLDISDKGTNGCRIKKIARGLAKDNGVLHEGDYITLINGTSLRVPEKNELDNCLRTISQGNGSYKITFLKKETVDIHKYKYSTAAACTMSQAQNGTYFRPGAAPDTKDSKSSIFDYFDVSVDNDGTTNLGLVLSPSLISPTRYVSITDIHADSLTDKCGLLKINDNVISVNNENLEGLTPAVVGRRLKTLIQTEEVLRFKIRRIKDDENDIVVKEFVNELKVISDLPDMYHCVLTKSQRSYGFSLENLGTDCGIVIRDIDSQSPASMITEMKSGHRIVSINNVLVNGLSLDSVIKMIKDSPSGLALIMETPKYREFKVRIVKDSSNSFGLNVAGGVDTKYPLAIIESIVPNTTCQYSEPLQSDDIIVEANEISISNRSHDEIIKILRTLPIESTFKIWRKLSFLRRECLDAMDSYQHSSQFSVIINKPVHSVPSFGINFSDIFIVDTLDNSIRQRYKAVISIERNSLSEMYYATQLTAYCYLISVNKTPVDVTMSNEELKKIIDANSQIELLLSRDIPYCIHGYDCRDDRTANGAEKEDQESLVQDTIDGGNTEPLYHTLTGHISSAIEAPVVNNDDQTDNADFGIKIHHIRVPKRGATKLGFRIFGGANGGPNGESMPVFVVAVERDSCNWAPGQEGPLLANGCQLLEMNARSVSTLRAADIERLCREAEGELDFTVLKVDSLS